MAIRQPASGVQSRRSILNLLLLVGCLLLACQALSLPPQSSPPPTPIIPATETASPTAVSATLPPTPTGVASPVPDTGWELLQAGLERRNLLLFDDQNQVTGSLYVLRLAPDRFRFGIAYRPGEPQTLPTWQAQTGALIVLNGGFFTPEFVATGRVVVDGQASGVGYGDFAGMWVVTETGPEIRWLAQQPYDPHEPLRYALQSFPLLVRPGGQLGFPDEDDRPARRTVVAEDRNGRILLMVAPRGNFTLHQLSRYLVESDFDLHVALNLDGGPSSGILLADPPEAILSITAVPIVITVHVLE